MFLFYVFFRQKLAKCQYWLRASERELGLEFNTLEMDWIQK